jgi:hypothetical protein
MLVTQKKKSRSGTQWTEEMYLDAGYSRMNLRVTNETRRKLAALSANLGQSETKVVEELIAEGYRGLRPKRG